MPPSTKVTKVKNGGKDIRMFFSGGTPSSSTPNLKQPPAPTLASTSRSNKKDKTIEISDDDQPVTKAALPRVEEDSDDEAPARRKASTLKRKKPLAVASSDDEEVETPPLKKKSPVSPTKAARPKHKPRPSATSSRKKVEDDDFEMSVSDHDDAPVPPKPKTAAKKAGAGATPQKKVEAESKDKGKAPPKPEKFDWAAAKAAKLAGPVAHGTKDVPDGAPDCLAGLSFVFTGELSSFSRDEAIDLAKRFGGRVVGQPSSKTNYVILGDNAGPSKIAAIRKHGINTLSEDEFLNLIATRNGPGNGEDIRKAAKEMEKREKKDTVTAAESSSGIRAIDPSSQLWTTRYAPQTLKEICGNKNQVEKLQLWLHDWSSSLKSGFKKPGKNGMNVFRAVMITGSPGIGKTTSAHLCAKLEGFTPIELNASDTRSKKLVENGMNINNTSLDGFVTGASKTNSVDGMSAGDRGGVGALNALIKKSRVPIICIANDRGAQKLKPLMATTFNLSFQKPQAAAIRSRILTIAFKEGLKIPANVIDQLVAGAQSDIRQVLNMLSTWKLSSDTMDFDEGKSLAKMNEKYSIMSPFDITSKMLGPYLFSSTARETLGDKMELYFQDHSFMPLFIQENYLKTQPARLRNLEGPDKELRQLELMDRAASSISDGDLVDALIHGPEQHWSLMPLHAVCSAVRPSSFQYGTGAHYGGPNSMSFPQWLGQNSKQSKLARQLGDVQIRMRLKVSGDKSEIRQSYIPALFPHIIRPLMETGSGAVDEVIDRMDEYYLTKEDWDTIVELGVDNHQDTLISKKISTATKSALTRKYNSKEHPIPFHKAQDLGKAPKKLAGGPAPDLEEAFEMDEVDDASEDDKSPSPTEDITNDKMIASKKKKAPTTKAKTKEKTKPKK
ncbi:purine nucleotide binding protein [Infundibulicybe gibba]|nr:purine nucleotide binding protein [Infundibulicybe gibba]